MASIEKICEFSNEYPGYAMYKYKHNHIQIMPKYRKEFRGVEHTLHVFKPDFVFTDDEIIVFYDENDYLNHGFDTNQEYIEWMKVDRKLRLVPEYSFILEIKNPNLQGEVKGRYMNQTRDLTATKRRLKRMLRCRKLNIVYHDHSIQNHN